MVYPENSLLLFDDQSSNILVYNITEEYATSMLRICDKHKTEREHIGQAISILHIQDSVLIRAQHYEYSTKRDASGQYYVTHVNTSEYSISNITQDHHALSELSRIVSTALMFAFRPRELHRMHNVYDLLCMMSNQMHTYNPQPLQPLRIMLAKNENSVNAIDTKAANIHIKHANVTDTLSMNAYVNNTYVNIVHDCERLCVYSMLSDEPDYMLTDVVKKHGLLCSRALSQHLLLTNAVTVRTTTMTHKSTPTPYVRSFTTVRLSERIEKSDGIAITYISALLVSIGSLGTAFALATLCCNWVSSIRTCVNAVINRVFNFFASYRT